ncbi:hypothetical protein CB0940_10394 [Cercospora beticola]|uniref:Cyanovirin-N domain-containing protein n=1 Tax=Cercospora beticola TaxID=122368 RepID=A0A2G5HTI2_CERBT|nr:hypothetical protein CB0940_10394 [Cercospora beticola]PIA95847.1 hypothetical protein CB0940_10394 [Cercospora beticola]WPB07111.1 hypothetical protein RHO25_011771 [Cercospora beticola]CAK1367061.1 unnamed protein product [Cercospora beticola]
MTRNTYDGPQGNSPYGGYPPQPAYGQQQQEYGGYPPGEGQGYNQQYQQYPGPGSNQGYGDNQGSAQSYYGRNDQPYQQYSHDRPQEQPPHQNYQSGPASGYTPAPGQYNHQYGGPPPPQDYPPPYGQQQQYPPHHMQQPSGQVDNFRSQFDQPYAQPNASGHYSQSGPYPPGASEQDRGLMGALAGGAAGAYGGHKMNHGVLGTIGGAVAGSMLEDAYKKKGKKDKKHKEHKPHHSRRGSSSSSSSSSSSDSDSSKDRKKKKKGMSAPAGNFHASSRNVYLESRSTLVAESADVRGHFQRTAIDLNDVFTNTNGKMHWARGGNFAGSARHIRLTDNGNCLEAELGDGRGGWIYNKVDLNERITNDNGRLHLL